MVVSTSKKTISLGLIFGTLALCIVVSILALNSRPTPGSCKILEEKYCKDLTLINFPGSEFKIVAFNLPIGTKVYSPVNGESQWGKMPVRAISYHSRTISVPSRERPEIAQYSYNLAFQTADNKYFTNIPKTVKEKEIMGTISDIKMEEFGDYNLIVVVHDRSSKDLKNRQLDSEKLLNKVFKIQ